MAVKKVYVLLEVCLEKDVPDIAELIASRAYMIEGVDHTMQGGVKVIAVENIANLIASAVAFGA